MPANKIENDPVQTIPASNGTVDSINSFNGVSRANADVINNSPAAVGAFKVALDEASEALRAESARFSAATEPRCSAIRAAAEDATRVAEDGAGSCRSIDVTI